MENERELSGGNEEAEVTEIEGPDDEAVLRELESGRAAIAELERTLESRNAEVAVLNRSLEEARNAVEELGESLSEAVAAYRGLVVQTNPGVPEEMITGDTIAAINDSLQNARALLERVRREIEAENARTRIPPGAPQRTLPDISALSPREKIQYALGG